MVAFAFNANCCFNGRKCWDANFSSYIKAIATKELSKSNFNRVVGKEFLIGILNGIIFAIITAIIVQLWFKELNLSLLIGISMILNMIVAGLFGILVPVSLKKLTLIQL